MKGLWRSSANNSLLDAFLKKIVEETLKQSLKKFLQKLPWYWWKSWKNHSINFWEIPAGFSEGIFVRTLRDTSEGILKKKNFYNFWNRNPLTTNCRNFWRKSYRNNQQNPGVVLEEPLQKFKYCFGRNLWNNI